MKICACCYMPHGSHIEFCESPESEDGICCACGNDHLKIRPMMIDVVDKHTGDRHAR